MTGMPERSHLTPIRTGLARDASPAYWRSLADRARLADTGRDDEFADGAPSWPDGVSRRRFLSLMAASLALAGASACTRPPGEKIVPYVIQPEQLLPGQPLYFATAMTLGGFATGVLVESHTGRPTKVEGNPQHPGSLGATDLFSQASVLGLYDPDRARAATRLGRIASFEDFAIELRRALGARSRGRGVRILTTTVTSPTLAAQLEETLRAYPDARWHEWEPVGPSDEARRGSLLAFDDDVAARYHLDRAARVLALDADVLACEPRQLRYIADFATRRRLAPGAPEMSRLYAVEATRTVTGSVADDRLALRASDIATFTAALARRLGIDVGTLSRELSGTDTQRWIDAVATDLQAHRGQSLIVPGDSQPAAVHALAHAMNARLDSIGRTVVYTEPVVARPTDRMASLRALVKDMRAGDVAVLLIIGGNPVYTAPADLDFAGALRHVELRAHLSPSLDETGATCTWHIPQTHYLEAWSDARGFDGTVTIVQPLIAPLFRAYSEHEVMALFGAQPLRRGHDLVREHWQRRHRGDDFEQFWREALHEGVVHDTEARPRQVALRADLGRRLSEIAPPAPGGGYEIVFRPDPTVHDGRFANNAWLQETPKPLTKLTWDNAVLVSARTAAQLGVADEDVVELTYRGRTLSGPALIVPGHAEGSVTVHLGYGRARAGNVGTHLGYNAYAIRTSTAPWFDTGLTMRKTGRRYALARTQQHHAMHGRPLVRETTFEQYRLDPGHATQAKHHAEDPAASLYPEWSYTGYAWGMSIDLAACTGCNACVVACYAENNIPVVGKEQVRMGREMAWLRVDTYFKGDVEAPETFHQPVPCMHCEQAPCEPVCPVMATVHSSEGLNDMVYNRCIGTRYCSNNCPYKVRRFNFLQYADWKDPLAKLARNPDVSVRSVGVMEKCTYCVQRINAARVQAETERRRIRDGEILTACQAACPTRAIAFGDVNDPTTQVHALKQLPRNYALLGELGTRPRTTYLAAVRHPNPELRRGRGEA
jgi:molybdopterin-containing oxidoreductase family iron-sulfur binding subunit